MVGHWRGSAQQLLTGVNRRACTFGFFSPNANSSIPAQIEPIGPIAMNVRCGAPAIPFERLGLGRKQTLGVVLAKSSISYRTISPAICSPTLPKVFERAAGAQHRL